MIEQCVLADSPLISNVSVHSLAAQIASAEVENQDDE